MYRIGHGYDVHRFSKNRELILGGVKIHYNKGLLGHSDADVLTHSIIDGVLGALALGDIGKHFPDNDVKYKDISSLKLLEKVVDIASEKGYILSNLDSTIIAERPKLLLYIDDMRMKISEIFNVDCDKINIKATTTEGMGFVGRIEGIAAHCVCLMIKK